MMLAHGLGVGGAEVMISLLARHLRAGGSEVEIGCLGRLGPLGEELRAEGFQIEVFERQPGFDRTLPMRLARRLRRGAFDVVHAHQRTGVFYALLAGFLDATPLVYTEHAPLFGQLPSRRKIAFNRLFGGRVRRITAVAECVRRALVEREGFGVRPIEIVPNAVDLARFGHAPPGARAAARSRNALPPDAVIMGTVGRLIAAKNHGMLLRVLGLLRQRVPDAMLVIVGQGPERSRLDRLAQEIGVADRVCFLGQRRNVEDILPAFDVFCLSSLSEGVPLTLLEAMAARVAVVATTAGGIAEAARSGREALLPEGVPPDCFTSLTGSGVDYVERFAGAVEQVLRDSAMRRCLTESAHERVVREFSAETVCRRYAEILAATAKGERQL